MLFTQEWMCDYQRAGSVALQAHQIVTVQPLSMIIAFLQWVQRRGQFFHSGYHEIVEEAKDDINVSAEPNANAAIIQDVEWGLESIGWDLDHDMGRCLKHIQECMAAARAGSAFPLHGEHSCSRWPSSWPRYAAAMFRSTLGCKTWPR